jgi:hypothetical protein
MKTLSVNDQVELQDLDGKVKSFRVASVNRVTYTIIHQWQSEKYGFQSISRSLRKDNGKLTR